MKKISFVLVALVTFLGILPITYAQEINKKGACKTDYEKFCKDVQPGQGRIVNCMRQHENELSAACRDEIARGREEAQGFMKACKQDAERFCKDVQPGQGRIINCLKANEAKLSLDCSAYFKK